MVQSFHCQELLTGQFLFFKKKKTLNCDIYFSPIKTSYLLTTLSHFVVTMCPTVLNKNVKEYYPLGSIPALGRKNSGCEPLSGC